MLKEQCELCGPSKIKTILGQLVKGAWNSAQSARQNRSRTSLSCNLEALDRLARLVSSVFDFSKMDMPFPFGNFIRPKRSVVSDRWSLSFRLSFPGLVVPVVELKM